MWAGISKRGATGIVICGGIITATRFGDILSSSLLPFIQMAYPDGHRLFFDKNGMNWWKSPAESPDLNPIGRYGPV